jgi:hypothetical protein
VVSDARWGQTLPLREKQDYEKKQGENESKRMLGGGNNTSRFGFGRKALGRVSIGV